MDVCLWCSRIVEDGYDFKDTEIVDLPVLWKMFFSPGATSSQLRALIHAACIARGIYFENSWFFQFLHAIVSGPAFYSHEPVTTFVLSTELAFGRSGNLPLFVQPKLTPPNFRPVFQTHKTCLDRWLGFQVREKRLLGCVHEEYSRAIYKVMVNHDDYDLFTTSEYNYSHFTRLPGGSCSCLYDQQRTQHGLEQPMFFSIVNREWQMTLFQANRYVRMTQPECFCRCQNCRDFRGTNPVDNSTLRDDLISRVAGCTPITSKAGVRDLLFPKETALDRWLKLGQQMENKRLMGNFDEQTIASSRVEPHGWLFGTEGLRITENFDLYAARYFHSAIYCRKAKSPVALLDAQWQLSPLRPIVGESFKLYDMRTIGYDDYLAEDFNEFLNRSWVETQKPLLTYPSVVEGRPHMKEIRVSQWKQMFTQFISEDKKDFSVKRQKGSRSFFPYAIRFVEPYLLHYGQTEFLSSNMILHKIKLLSRKSNQVIWMTIHYEFTAERVLLNIIANVAFHGDVCSYPVNIRPRRSAGSEQLCGIIVEENPRVTRKNRKPKSLSLSVSVAHYHKSFEPCFSLVD